MCGVCCQGPSVLNVYNALLNNDLIKSDIQCVMSAPRDLNRLDNAKSAKATDALLNYETVKYFSNEDLERSNFDKAIQNYQKVEYTLIASLNGLNVLQSVIIWSGMISGLVVCTKVSTL